MGTKFVEVGLPQAGLKRIKFSFHFPLLLKRQGPYLCTRHDFFFLTASRAASHSRCQSGMDAIQRFSSDRHNNEESRELRGNLFKY